MKVLRTKYIKLFYINKYAAVKLTGFLELLIIITILYKTSKQMALYEV